MLGNARVTAVVPATDLQRARSFYEDKLGLRPLEMDYGEEAVMYECGANTHLYVYRRGEPTRAEHTAVFFEVSDVEGTVDDLSRRGVRFEHYDLPGIVTDDRGIATMGNSKTAWFKDTEGNILAVGHIAERAREAGR